MILWDGIDVHDPPATEKCWADKRGEDCGEPATISGLCLGCFARITGAEVSEANSA